MSAINSILNPSLEKANLYYSIAGAASIIGAVLVLIGSWGANHYGAIRERYTDERISANERITAEAVKASLILQKEIMGRGLNPEQRSRFIAAIRPFAPRKYLMNISMGTDTISLFLLLEGAFSEAGWERLPAPQDNGNIISGDLNATADLAAGLSVKYSPSHSAALSPIARAIADALTSEGIPTMAKSSSDADEHPDILLIVVGSK